MEIRYPEIGICGLSCQLCPSYHTYAKSRCGGCKSEERINLGCPFITCAIKKKEIEFCWECKENKDCEKWGKHRETGKNMIRLNATKGLRKILLLSRKRVSKNIKDYKT